MELRQAGAGKRFRLLRQALALQRKTQHGAPGDRRSPARRLRPSGRPHRRLSQHRKTHQRRRHRQSDVQAPERRTSPLSARNPRNPAGLYTQRKRPLRAAVRHSQHPLPCRPVCAAKGHQAPEIRRTVLPAAEPSQAEIHPQPRQSGPSNAQGRRCLQLLI